MVRVGYDKYSNVKAGIYPVESFSKIIRGDLIRLSVERPLMGLRCAKVTATVEKVKS